MAKQFLLRRSVFILAFFILAGLIYALGQDLSFPTDIIHLDTAVSQLPRYAVYSLMRMFLAYLLSFFFSIAYGYIAATSPKAEGPMVAFLDVLQSIPILGFFPVAVIFFVSLFNGSRIGVEVASIFLIFTSMSWNMAFSVYESFKTVPSDLVDAAGALGLSGWHCFSKALFPICIPRLIYSSMISWAGGWYFLIAAEIIAIGPVKHELPGLGSFLIHSTENGQVDRTILALLLLVGMIILFNLFVWQPLGVWSEKFRYEFSVSGPPRHSFSLLWYRKILATTQFRALRKLSFFTLSPLKKTITLFQRFGGKMTIIVIKGMGVLCLVAIFYAVSSHLIVFVEGFSKPFPIEIRNIPIAIGASFLRLVVAYILALSWTLPVAYWVGQSPPALKVVTPIAEIGAAIPAPALFPFIILFGIHVMGGMNAAAILLILTGMQWYLLFNLLGGVQNIPADLKEVARSLGLSRWHAFRRLFLPAVFPALITGSITAWGGGWNALIVSEYLIYRHEIHSVTGIGAMLDQAIYESGDAQMILITLLSMILTITLLNRFFWRKLYVYALGHFKIEY